MSALIEQQMPHLMRHDVAKYEGAVNARLVTRVQS